MIAVHFYLYNLSINVTSYFQQTLHRTAKIKNEIEIIKQNNNIIMYTLLTYNQTSYTEKDEIRSLNKWFCHTTLTHFYSRSDYIENNCIDKKFNM